MTNVAAVVVVPGIADVTILIGISAVTRCHAVRIATRLSAALTAVSLAVAAILVRVTMALSRAVSGALTGTLFAAATRALIPLTLRPLTARARVRTMMPPLRRIMALPA